MIWSPENQHTLLIPLLVRVGLMAAMASMLARSRYFKKALFTEQRDFKQKLLFCLFWGGALVISVIIRIRTDYKAFDLGLEGVFVAGLLGGNVIGALTGGLIGITASFHREWVTLPLAPILGMSAGLLRNLCPAWEEIWNFSPFTPINTILALGSKKRLEKMQWQITFMLVWLSFDAIRYLIGPYFTGRNGEQWIFSFPEISSSGLVIIFLVDILCVGLTIKIWNNTRLEMKLAEQQILVVKSRLDALANQINPHFLFNTLNSISSLIRSNPEKARQMVIKLSHILRKLLQGHENFVTLKEELEFIDNYLDIEVIRFGKDKLRIEKDIDPIALEAVVPSMILQPLVENAIKHGVSPKIEGGSIRIHTYLRRERIHIDVSDDGMGIPQEKLSEIYNSGIGISNIVERLKVAYQNEFVFQVNSNLGYGTFTHIEIPVSWKKDAQ